METLEQAWQRFGPKYNRALKRKKEEENKHAEYVAKMQRKRERRKQMREVSRFICNGKRMADDQLPKELLKNFNIEVKTIQDAYRAGQELIDHSGTRKLFL